MESSPAEVSGKCHRHESGEGVGVGGREHERGIFPLIRGSGKFLNYRRLYVRFNAFCWGGGGCAAEGLAEFQLIWPRI